jgi:hypothetical protein
VSPMPKHEPEIERANTRAKIRAWLFEDKRPERPGEFRKKYLFLCELNPHFRTAALKEWGFDPITGKKRSELSDSEVAIINGTAAKKDDGNNDNLV